MVQRACFAIFLFLAAMLHGEATAGEPRPDIYIDSLTSGATVSGTVTISGWAIRRMPARGPAIRSVQVLVDGARVGTATYGIPRPDVCGEDAARSGCPNVGFRYQLSTAFLDPGTHTVTVAAPESGRTHSVAVSVAAMTPPAVYIDSLAPGASISGIVDVAGWALDPATNDPAIDRVQIHVDGTPVGTATYGTLQPHACAAYPLAARASTGCPHVGFTYPLHAAALPAGTHTLTVVATNSQANVEMGSYSLAVNVLATPSSITLYSSASSSIYFQNVTLTAVVSPPSATGSVTFEDSGNVLGTGTLVNGQAVLTTGLLGAGTRSLRAFYSGSPVYAASNSGVVTQVVNAPPANGMQPVVNYQADDTPYAVAVGDLNGDGKPDLAVANQGSDNVSILLGNGNGSFQAPVNYDTDSYPIAVAVADFNGDGRPDLIISSAGSVFPYANQGTLNVLLGNGDGTFQPAVNYTIGNGSGPIVVGDFNGDGKADVAVGGRSRLSVLLGNGDGTLQPAMTSVGTFVYSLAAGDFNGDGNIDLATSTLTSGGIYVVSVRLGNGNGTFQPSANYGPGTSPGPIAIGDFNGDGKADIAATHFNDNNVSILLGNGDGTLRAGRSYFAGNGPISVAVGDFNGDGNSDLAFANRDGYNVSLIMGNGNGTFGSALNKSVSRLPTSLAIGDFNGDGRADLAITSAMADPTSGILFAGSLSVLLAMPAVPPAVFIDSITPGATVTGTITISGWALDNAVTIGTRIGNVQVRVDGVLMGIATYGTPRGDVCGAYPGRPGCPNVGFTYQLNTASLAAGTRTITVIATDTDVVPSSGSFSMAVNVVGSPPPAVFIDSITAGATLAGTVTISGWAIDNAITIGTKISNVQVLVDGAVVGTATYGTPRGDVCGAYPGRPGCPNVGFTYQLNAASLAPGIRTLTVVATDTDVVPSSGSFSISVNVVGTPPPAAFIDSLTPGATVSGTVTVSGWAIDNAITIGTKISGVQVMVDGVLAGTATYGTPRGDVCGAYPGRPGCPNVGFTYQLNTAALSAGSHTVTVVATDTDMSPNSGSYSLKVNVVALPPPMVYIDSLSAGATVSGTVTVSGWAINGTTAIGSVQVKVDGTTVGTATYGTPRGDVCGAYPGRPGCPNVGFTYQLNTASLSAGTHTVTVVATDTAGTPGLYSMTVKK